MKRTLMIMLVSSLMFGLFGKELTDSLIQRLDTSTDFLDTVECEDVSENMVVHYTDYKLYVYYNSANKTITVYTDDFANCKFNNDNGLIQRIKDNVNTDNLGDTIDNIEIYKEIIKWRNI